MTDERHATTEELLAVRDGEGSGWAKGHVDECAACAAELYRLEQVRAQLRALPSFTPPRDRWAVVAYVRALQLSQRARIDLVPPAERARLQGGGTP